MAIQTLSRSSFINIGYRGAKFITRLWNSLEFRVVQSGREEVMKELQEGLYIGDFKDVAMVKAAGVPTVSHVLSFVGSSISPLDAKHPVETPRADKLQNLALPLQDVELQNLLDNLEGCLEFFEKGRNHGSVLVNCLAGISRKYL